jgi:peptidyl-dipeptidase A
VTLRLASLAGAIVLALAGCRSDTGDRPAAGSAAVQAPRTAADADAFVAAVNAEIRANYNEQTAAQWVSETYINGDTEMLVSRANERALERLSRNVEKAKAYTGVAGVAPATQRAFQLLRLSTPMPAPKDPAKLAELTQIASRLNAAYGAGKSCKDPNDPTTCRDLTALSDVLARNRDWDAQLDAWVGWHDVARGMRADYQRFAALVNDGAGEMGFANAGEMWRAGYDMAPADFRAETDRLWQQVAPLYGELQCYARTRLEAEYGERMPDDGTIPAHITGNMWAQDWSALYPLLQPFPGVGNLDVDAALESKGYDARKMTRQAEDFYLSLGMPKLPESFWQRSQFVKPADRDVVCHASAWDMNLEGDVRLKMCIKPNEEEFRTIYHELGHIYYFLAYNHLDPLFQAGAHDGFHEAIGDTVQLSLTPRYLNTIGLAGAPQQSREAMLNAQMKLALEKVVFLPFGKLIDEWRWGVFDGSIKPADYNTAWWKLRRKYQGVAPTVARTEQDFDPGAKYHVPGNTPYMRYFLAHILQFQFQKALCDAAGHQGPLHECSVYGNAEAGKRYWAMLSKGASQPWPQTLKELTGTEQMDASAIQDYFATLLEWLKEQNAGKACGWSDAAPATG